MANRRITVGVILNCKTNNQKLTRGGGTLLATEGTLLATEGTLED